MKGWDYLLSAIIIYRIIIIIIKFTRNKQTHIHIWKRTSFKWCTYFVWSAGCIQALAPSGSSFKEVTGPLGWFMSAPVGGRPNISPPPLGPEVGYSLRPHSNSSVGHGEAELKPGTDSSERSLKPLYSLVSQNILNPFDWSLKSQNHTNCFFSPINIFILIFYYYFYRHIKLNKITSILKGYGKKHVWILSPEIVNVRSRVTVKPQLKSVLQVTSCSVTLNVSLTLTLRDRLLCLYEFLFSCIGREKIYNPSAVFYRISALKHIAIPCSQYSQNGMKRISRESNRISQ